MSVNKVGTVLLVAATGAANSDDFAVDRVPITVSIYPEANFAAETGDLAKKNPDGTYDDQYTKAGDQIRLSATLPSFVVSGGGTFRIEFSARTAAIGVSIQEAPISL